MSPHSKVVSIHWFRQDLRLHDNPALLEALNGCDEFYPVFIFDGKVASTERSHFLRIRFLRESLQDIDDQLRDKDGRLYVIQGETIATLRHLFEEWGVTRLTYQEEPEAIWKSRDDAVTRLCEECGVEKISRSGHTLWDPHEVIERNGGNPPLTYSIFCHVTDAMGSPDRPSADPDFGSSLVVTYDYNDRFMIPSYSDLGFGEEAQQPDVRLNKWVGGEMIAIRLVQSRLEAERQAFTAGAALPNQMLPDLLAPPTSLSSHLKFGCISVRRFYYSIVDTYVEVTGDGRAASQLGIVSQLIWREYFYTMSAQNINYGQITDNPICLPIRWSQDPELERKVEMGETGYPFVDAIMNQLRVEGWVHHVGRHMLASYLTRGDLWLSWEAGVRIFEKYLLDYDWSICAGNWMWASSSAFEKALDCPRCFDPVKYGMRMDPDGQFVRRYVPALKDMPLKYLFRPWMAPHQVQEDAGCIVGSDYPQRLNDHSSSARQNRAKMELIRTNFFNMMMTHCAPSDPQEVRKFVWLPADDPSCCTDCTAMSCLSKSATNTEKTIQ